MADMETGRITTLTWVRDRLNEHIAAVCDMEDAGRKGDMFALGNGLAQLRNMMLLNAGHLTAVLGGHDEA